MPWQADVRVWNHDLLEGGIIKARSLRAFYLARMEAILG